MAGYVEFAAGIFRNLIENREHQHTMETPLTVLRGYSDRVEAETLRIRLAAAGIPAYVTGTDAATALGLGGAATWRMVRVEVPTDDYVRATLLLEEDQRRLLEEGPWICNRCREQNEAAFEVCWSCAKPRNKDDARGRLDKERGFQPDAAFESAPQLHPRPRPDPNDLNPYRPVLLDGDPESRSRRPRTDEFETDETTESVIRALRAAIVGTLLLPPILNFYSVYLLVNLNPAAYHSPSLRKRITIAWCINLVMIPAWVLWWHMMIFM